MIDNREIKRFNLKFGKYLDPLGLFLLLAVFVIPTLAVVNLSPKAKVISNVLGVESKQELSVVLVGGVHEYIKQESISFPTNKHSRYEAVITKHNEGSYSKPVVQISNSFSNESTVEVSGGTQNPTGSPIYFIYQGNEYLLQDESGVTNIISVKVPSQSKEVGYLRFDTKLPVKFSENVELNIVQK